MYETDDSRSIVWPAKKKGMFYNIDDIKKYPSDESMAVPGVFFKCDFLMSGS